MLERGLRGRFSRGWESQVRRVRQEVPLPGGRISWSLSVGESEGLSPSPCSTWMPPVTGGSQLNGLVSSFQTAEAPSASSGEAELFPGASGRSRKHQLSAPSLSLSVSPGARPSGPRPPWGGPPQPQAGSPGGALWGRPFTAATAAAEFRRELSSGARDPRLRLTLGATHLSLSFHRWVNRGPGAKSHSGDKGRTWTGSSGPRVAPNCL